MTLVIDDLQATNSNLQTQVDTLTQTAFISDQAETQRLRAVEADHLGKLGDLRAMLIERDASLAISTDKLNEQVWRSRSTSSSPKNAIAAKSSSPPSQSAKIERLEAELARASSERDELAHDAVQTTATLGDLRRRVDVFTGDAGIDIDDFERALDMIRRLKPQSSSSSKMVTIPSLQRRVRELEILNKDLVTEVKSKNDMLRLQTQLNAELDAAFNRSVAVAFMNLKPRPPSL